MKRNSIIDIMKAIGIFLMVLGHSGFIFTNWIYQFHMAMFFIIAGYCFNNKYLNDQKSLINLFKNRVKSLYLPCFLFNSIIVIFHNLFLKYNFISGFLYSYKDTAIHLFKCFLFSGGENLSGAMWFLRTMFFSTIIFASINFLCQKYLRKFKTITWVIYIILLFVGWRFSTVSFGKYFNIFTVLILVQIGNSLKDKINIHLNFCIAIISIVIGFLFTTIPLFFVTNSISLTSNQIINPFYFVFCSCSGTLLCLGIANLLKHTCFKDLLEYIGKNTLIIVMWHFLAMKIITLLQIIIYKENITLLSSHPFLYSNLMWNILYTISGIAIPLLIHLMFCQIKKQLERKNLYE